MASAPILLSRQKRLLALLKALGGSVNSRDFQKLLFLYCQEEFQPAPYEFVPGKFGAFSFTSHGDRRRLVERGLISDDEHRWMLTDAGRRTTAIADASLADFVARYRRLRGDGLVAETYRRYPYYAIRSEIAGEVLAGDVAALRRIRRSRPPRHSGLATVGYEGSTLEGYLNRLLRAGVSLLCDVRRNPLSRKYGFSKRALATACEGVGMRYEHMPQLGVPSEDRRTLKTRADYDALFERYVRGTLPRQRRAIETIRTWIEAGDLVALTCYERSPTECHRHCVAHAVERAVPALITRHL